VKEMTEDVVEQHENQDINNVMTVNWKHEEKSSTNMFSSMVLSGLP